MYINSPVEQLLIHTVAIHSFSIIIIVPALAYNLLKNLFVDFCIDLVISLHFLFTFVSYNLAISAYGALSYILLF